MDYRILQSLSERMVFRARGWIRGLMGKQLCLMVSHLTTALMPLSQIWCNLESH